MRTLRHHSIWIIVLLCAGCGTPGPPQPPSLRLPKPVADLQVIRKGDDVYLRWTVPNKTTDGAGIRPADLGETGICRGYVTRAPNSCRDFTASFATKTDATGHQTAVDHIAGYVGGDKDFLSYSVKVNNSSGRNAGPSNSVLIFIAPSLAAPPTLDAQLKPNVVLLSWQAHELPVSANLKAEYFYRIKRTPGAPDKKNAAEVALAELPARPGRMTFEDHAFAWEKTYHYTVAGMTRVISRDGKTLAEFEGQDSPVAEVVTHDIFPPPVPSGLQAVYSSLEANRFIDLTWTPDMETDLAGYNVYRSEGNAAAVKINSGLVRTQSFRDDHVAAGKTYTYTVSAVDARGNESARSPQANEKVPE